MPLHCLSFSLSLLLNDIESYVLQVEALFELIKGLIEDLDGTPDDEVISIYVIGHTFVDDTKAPL